MNPKKRSKARATRTTAIGMIIRNGRGRGHAKAVTILNAENFTSRTSVYGRYMTASPMYKSLVPQTQKG